MRCAVQESLLFSSLSVWMWPPALIGTLQWFFLGEGRGGGGRPTVCTKRRRKGRRKKQKNTHEQTKSVENCPEITPLLLFHFLSFPGMKWRERGGGGGNLLGVECCFSPYGTFKLTSVANSAFKHVMEHVMRIPLTVNVTIFFVNLLRL